MKQPRDFCLNDYTLTFDLHSPLSDIQVEHVYQACPNSFIYKVENNNYLEVTLYAANLKDAIERTKHMLPGIYLGHAIKSYTCRPLSMDLGGE